MRPDHFYKNTATYYGSPTRDKFGKISNGGSGTVITGRFTRKQIRIKDAEGKDLSADGMFKTSADTSIELEKNLEIGNTKYKIVEIKKTPDKNGNFKFQNLIVKKTQV